MLKKILLIQFFFLILIYSKISATEKLVYLDINFILNQSKPAKIIISKIEKTEKKEISKLKSIEENLKKENDEIIKTKNLISEEEYKNKINDFRKKLKKYEENKRNIVISLNNEKKKELDKLLNKINPIIKNYMEKNSIDMIIDRKNIYLAKKNFDITNDILELVNKEIK